MPCRGEIPLRSEPDRDEGRQRDGGGTSSYLTQTEHGNWGRSRPADGLTLLELQLGREPCEAKLRAGSRVKPIGKR